MSIKPIFEFILWDNCCNNCSFCWQKIRNNNLNDTQKVNRLQVVCDFIVGPTYIKGSHILLVGGELFDTKNQMVCGELLTTYRTISELMNTGDVDLLYINTNLLYDCSTALYPVLELVANQGLINRLRFTTSYDIAGRFLSPDRKQLFFANLKDLKHRFPDLNIVVNTILTKYLCETYRANENYSIVGMFLDEFGVNTNLIPYINIDDSLTPSRNDVFEVLMREWSRSRQFIYDYVGNFDLKQEKRIYDLTEGVPKYVTDDVNPCGHGKNFTKYSPKGTCFVCDIKEMFNVR